MISTNWKEALEPVDYVRSGVMLVAVLATGFGSAETWIQADTLAMSIFGTAWVLFPEHLLTFQTDVKLDFMHTVFGQSIGAMMLSLAAFNILNRKSKDPNVWLGVFISRIVGGFALLPTQILILSGDRKQKGWTLQFLTFSVLSATLYLIANVVQTWKASTSSTTSSQRGLSDHLSKHIFMTALLELVAVFQTFSHFEQLANHFFVKAHPFDVVHYDMGKYCACTMLICAVLTLASLNFEDNKARKSLILIKFVVIFCMLLLDISLQYRFNIYKKDMFVWEVVQYIPFLAVTGLGYFHTAKHM